MWNIELVFIISFQKTICFESRFTDNEHKALLDTLQCIHTSSWISVFYTSTFQNYRLEVANSHRMTLSASELSCFTHLNLCSYNAHSIHNVCKSFVNGKDYISTKEMCAYMVCACFRESLQSFDLHHLSDRNKSFYNQFKRTLGFFKISFQRDSISSWLLFASFLFKCKRFPECLVIINYSLSNCTPDTIFLDFENSLLEQTVFRK